MILDNYSDTLAKAAWYIGTIGFIVYFLHRYEISEKRAKLIKQLSLSEKVNTVEGLSGEERQALDYILKTLKSTKEKWNYVFIFAVSAIALVIGLYLDFLR